MAITKTKKPRTAGEKNALIFQFLDLVEKDTAPRSRALTSKEEAVLRAMAMGDLTPEALGSCEKLLLGNRCAMEFLAVLLKEGRTASSSNLSRHSRDEIA